ncbi:MAG: hypothetical protein RL640_780, partial [Bacteroidota bacterium]
RWTEAVDSLERKMFDTTHLTHCRIYSIEISNKHLGTHPRLRRLVQNEIEILASIIPCLQNHWLMEF